MSYNNISKLEALLFTSDEPVPLKELARVMELPQAEVKDIIESLKLKYEQKDHGIMIREYEKKYLLTTKAEFSPWIEELHQKKQQFNLTQPALETLAIIAYKQPVTRAEIEEIRGVKAEKTLNTLAKYDLIQELGRKETIGNPIVYGTTSKFLQLFNLEDLSQLPELEEKVYE